MKFLSQLVEPVTGLLEKVIPDKDKAAALAHDIATLASKQQHAERLGQMEVNKQEAAHKSLFVAGWRPFTGWVCAAAMLFNYMLFPLINAVFEQNIALIDTATMMPVLMGMLGLGAARTVEKARGVSREI